MAVVDGVAAVAADADAAAVGAASWRDAPTRREDRLAAIPIPAAANPTALGESEVVARRCRNASRR